jgi:hypothetical protein
MAGDDEPSRPHVPLMTQDYNASVQLRADPSAAGSSRVVIISNMEPPRLSTDGEIVNAHDGTVRSFNGKWYMHAAQYGECADPPRHGCEASGPTQAPDCGFHPNHNVSIWSSPDLSTGSWQFEGQAV